MKRILVFVLAVMCCICLAGCASAGPDQMVRNYFEAVKSYDTQKMASYINGKKTDSSDTQNNDTVTRALGGYLKECASKVTCQVNKTEITGSNAVVNVTCKYVDSTELINQMLTTYITRAMPLALKTPKPTDEDLSKLIVEILNEKKNTVKTDMVEKTFDIKCVKENNVWKIESVSDDLSSVLTSNVYVKYKNISQMLDTKK